MTDSELTKVCPRCQTEKPASEFYSDRTKKNKLSYDCKVCRKQYYKKYCQANLEKKQGYGRKYYQDNLEELKEKNKKYRESNEYNKKYYEKNKEKENSRGKDYRARNKDKMKKYYKNYNKKNNEKRKIYAKEYRQTPQGKATSIRGKHKRRALKLKATVENFNPIEVFERDKYICQSCGCKTRRDYKNHNHLKFTCLDHIIPLSKGGEHSRINTQCLCRKCNAEKNNNQKHDQLLMFGI